jgi:hypothetical protein
MDEEELDKIINDRNTPSKNGEKEEMGNNDRGIFTSTLEHILWKRTAVPEDGTEPYEEFLVKTKEQSYLHLEWVTEEELLEMGKQSKMKLSRFKKAFEQNYNVLKRNA